MMRYASSNSGDIRFAAMMLFEVSQREKIVELELRSYLNHPQFAPYRAVLSKYGMGERVQALIISQLYPFENYLDPNTGKPIVITSKGKKSGQPTRKTISARRFRKALGIAPQREQSGGVPLKPPPPNRTTAVPRYGSGALRGSRCITVNCKPH